MEPRSNLPLIILLVAVAAVVIYFATKKKDPYADYPAGELPPEEAAAAQAAADPCLKPDGTRLPDWACGTVTLLNPLAKASVDVAKIRAGV